MTDITNAMQKTIIKFKIIGEEYYMSKNSIFFV